MNEFKKWWRRNYIFVLFPLVFLLTLCYGFSLYTFYQEYDRLPVSDWEMLSWITGL